MGLSVDRYPYSTSWVRFYGQRPSVEQEGAEVTTPLQRPQLRLVKTTETDDATAPASVDERPADAR